MSEMVNIFGKQGVGQWQERAIPVAIETGSVPRKWQLIALRGSSIGVGNAASTLTHQQTSR